MNSTKLSGTLLLHGNQYLCILTAVLIVSCLVNGTLGHKIGRSFVIAVPLLTSEKPTPFLRILPCQDLPTHERAYVTFRQVKTQYNGPLDELPPMNFSIPEGQPLQINLQALVLRINRPISHLKANVFFIDSSIDVMILQLDHKDTRLTKILNTLESQKRSWYSDAEINYQTSLTSKYDVMLFAINDVNIYHYPHSGEEVVKLPQKHTMNENQLKFLPGDRSQHYIRADDKFLLWSVMNVDVCSMAKLVKGRDKGYEGRGQVVNGRDQAVGGTPARVVKLSNSVDVGGVARAGEYEISRNNDERGVAQGAPWYSAGSSPGTDRHGEPGRKRCTPEISQLPPNTVFGRSFMIPYAKGGQLHMIAGNRSGRVCSTTKRTICNEVEAFSTNLLSLSSVTLTYVNSSQPIQIIYTAINTRLGENADKKALEIAPLNAPLNASVNTTDGGKTKTKTKTKTKQKTGRKPTPEVADCAWNVRPLDAWTDSYAVYRDPESSTTVVMVIIFKIASAVPDAAPTGDSLHDMPTSADHDHSQNHQSASDAHHHHDHHQHQQMPRYANNPGYEEKYPPYIPSNKKYRFKFTLNGKMIVNRGHDIKTRTLDGFIYIRKSFSVNFTDNVNWVKSWDGGKFDLQIVGMPIAARPPKYRKPIPKPTFLPLRPAQIKRHLSKQVMAVILSLCSAVFLVGFCLVCFIIAEFMCKRGGAPQHFIRGHSAKVTPWYGGELPLQHDF